MYTHKKLKEVLYSIIALAVIIWAIVYVQVKSRPVVEMDAKPTQETSNQLTIEQRTQVVRSIQETSTKLAPLTDNQRSQILKDLQKQYTNQ